MTRRQRFSFNVRVSDLALYVYFNGCHCERNAPTLVLQSDTRLPAICCLLYEVSSSLNSPPYWGCHSIIYLPTQFEHKWLVV